MFLSLAVDITAAKNISASMEVNFFDISKKGIQYNKHCSKCYIYYYV